MYVFMHACMDVYMLAGMHACMYTYSMHDNIGTLNHNLVIMIVIVKIMSQFQ